MTSGVDAYWGGESQAVSDSNPLFGVVTLSLRELVARVRIPNRLLQNSTDLETKVREDIIKRMRLKMDYSFLFGSGAKPAAAGNTGQEPLGIVNVPGVTNTSLGANGARPRLTDLTASILRLETANVEHSDNWGWVMHPRTKTTFLDMTDTTGVPLLRASWSGEEATELMGYPFYVSTQVPIAETVGSATTCSYIILGDWSYAVVGMGMDVEITVDTSRYVNERETLIQAVALTDFGVYYPEAFETLSGVLA
jgi:HK97 family phage major capsid protein